jgi:hypothetical protein
MAENPNGTRQGFSDFVRFALLFSALYAGFVWLRHFYQHSCYLEASLLNR